MQRYIVSHTSMRGVAALLVVVYHLQFAAWFYLPWETATPFFKVGYLWVDLFFILSGFVISYSARADERAPYSWPQIRDFWVHRIARIYPLHLFALFTLLAVTIAMQVIATLAHARMALSNPWSTVSILNFLEQLFLLNAWGLTGRIGWNIPSWSISAELFAYLLYPVLAAMMVRWRTAALAGMALLAIAFYAWIGLTTGVLDIVKSVAVLRCLAGFSLGMVIYAVRDRIAACSDSTLGIMQAIGLVIVLATMCLGLNDVLVMPGFVLLIAATWPDRGWLARPLKTAPLHWLGEISYSVYLNHFWVLGAWHFVLWPVQARIGLEPWINRSIDVAGAIMLVLLVSHFSYRLIEKPARRAIVAAYHARLGKAPAVAPEPAV